MKQYPQIVVFDFGGQTAHLIARRIRELGVFAELVSHRTTALALRKNTRLRGIIFSGGPSSIYEPGAPSVDSAVLSVGVPILGICYGMQLLGQHLGGTVERGTNKEFGDATVMMTHHSLLFQGLRERASVWMSHSDQVVQLPSGFTSIARTRYTPNAAMEDPIHNRFGVQFHPEVEHTKRGREILGNFLFGISRAKKDWSYRTFINDQVENIRTLVGKERVVCGLSGGIDSATAAALVFRAIGNRLSNVFVDTGLLRAGEADEVRRAFRRYFRGSLVSVDASSGFLSALRGVTNPERKRRIIGETFIRVFEKTSENLGSSRFLVQGTIYPDVIESAGAKHDTASVIKTHHNVGGLPKRHHFVLVEPLRELYKDEVRAVAKALGLPEGIIWRQPFPGPGLAIRIRGVVTRQRLERLRLADGIVKEELRKAKIPSKASWMTFAIYVPLSTTGVKGDRRAFEDMIAIRSLQSSDAMTADWSRLPYPLLARISTRIVDEVPGITRVVYDITTKPPATMEWE